MTYSQLGGGDSRFDWLTGARTRSLPPSRLLLLSIAPRAGSPLIGFLWLSGKQKTCESARLYKTRACGWVSLSRGPLKKMSEWEMCSSRCEYCVGGAMECVSRIVINDCLLLKAHFHGSDKFYCRRLFHSAPLLYNTAPYNLICLQRAHTIYQLFGMTV